MQGWKPACPLCPAGQTLDQPGPDLPLQDGGARMPPPARHHHGRPGDGPEGPLHGQQDGNLAAAAA